MSQEEKIKIANTLKDLLKNGSKNQLRLFLNDQYPQDIAEAIEDLKEKERITCFLLLDIEHAGDVLSELNNETQKNLLKVLGSKKLAPIISEMDIDDATELISNLEEEDKKEVIEDIPDPIHQAHIQEQIEYPDESAGRIMTTDILSLNSAMTIENAINYARSKSEEFKSTIYYIYVVDNTNTLVGVLSLRNLICADLNDLVKNQMETEIITCNVLDDQETVAKEIAKYNLIAIPIVDDLKKLKGVVTVDDVVDILKEETTEDIYQGSGISDLGDADELISSKVSYAYKARLPWLLLTLLGQAIASFIIARHNFTISHAPIAISFMPLLSGLSGNVGSQTSTIIIRGLVTGDIEVKHTIKHILHELKTGILLGLTCALITGLIAWYYHSMPFLGIVVGIALIISMATGVFLGTVFPIILQSLRKDPAAASSPLITTLLDIFTFTIYLTIITLTINRLN